MPATTPRPRSARRKSADTKKVENILRELAYILHVTRKLNQETDWPVLRREPAAN